MLDLLAREHFICIKEKILRKNFDIMGEHSPRNCRKESKLVENCCRNIVAYDCDTDRSNLTVVSKCSAF